MKFLRFFIILPLLSTTSFAQKPVIDSMAYRNWNDLAAKRHVNWEQVETPVLSADGRYMKYNHIGNDDLHELVICSTDAKWSYRFKNSFFAAFSTDGNRAYLALRGDSLAIINLGTDKVEYRSKIWNPKTFVDHNRDFLTWGSPENHEHQTLWEIATGKEAIYDDVAGVFQNDHNLDVITQTPNVSPGDQFTLRWAEPVACSAITVCEGQKASDFIFSTDNHALFFKVIESSFNPDITSIWYFKKGMPKAEKVLDGRTIFEKEQLLIDDIQQVSTKGDQIFFTLKDVPIGLKVSTSPAIVWSYADAKLRTLHDKTQSPARYLGTVSLTTRQYQRLTFPGESSSRWGFVDRRHDEIALVEHRTGNCDADEWHWNKNSDGMEYLLFTKTGDRLPIAKLSGYNLQDFRIDPSEKFVLYYDRVDGNYFSFEIATRKCRNITQQIKRDWLASDFEYPKAGSYTEAFTGWIAGGRFVLLHDYYDLWKIDLLGEQSPVNVTNSYGRKHHTVFRLAINNITNIFRPDEVLLLNAFDKSNKDNGFYQKRLGSSGDPEKLSMGPFFYEAPRGLRGIDGMNGMEPLKANDSNRWIVKRMSAKDAPNYFSTSDFKTFTRLSNVQPAAHYNWYTTEVFHYKGLDGSPLDALLYKPEDFDPKKKYPVIFHYYEKLSDRKNVYLTPGFADGPIDIPTYVSNGYLVVTPGIHYTVGSPGQSAVNSVVAAAQSIAKRPFVDKTRMGIQGHSFGGYQTNFLVTHTHLFAAACTASGIADLASGSGALSSFDGRSWQSFYETAQMRLGTSIGKNPGVYIRNSAIYYAKNVTTPLLLMHTTHDDIFPFSNAVEFFTALRREGKKVWMLQYDASHSLDDLQQAKDYTIRQMQFFDHYLKGKPAPEWMTGTN